MKIIQICRIDNSEKWDLVGNMRLFSIEFKASEMILVNSFNEYLEYKNSAVVYRFIREEDKSKYGVD